MIINDNNNNTSPQLLMCSAGFKSRVCVISEKNAYVIVIVIQALLLFRFLFAHSFRLFWLYFFLNTSLFPPLYSNSFYVLRCCLYFLFWHDKQYFTQPFLFFFCFCCFVTKSHIFFSHSLWIRLIFNSVAPTERVWLAQRIIIFNEFIEEKRLFFCFLLGIYSAYNTNRFKIWPCEFIEASSTFFEMNKHCFSLFMHTIHLLILKKKQIRIMRVLFCMDVVSSSNSW